MELKKIFKVLLGFVFVGLVLYCIDQKQTPEELHKFHLENSPYKKTQKLSKKERFSKGLPPDKFYEQLYDLTMDPTTGRPDIETKSRVSQQLEYQKANEVRRQAVPGQSAATPWYTIGPNNQAGRTRAALFDLADLEKDRVIAGGVSGGLWVNEDIDATTPPSWTRITGVPGNLAVSNIIQDPDDNQILFVGTGESYTSGDVTGNGIYKSTDRGVNWTQVFGSSSGIVTSTFSSGSWLVEGYFYINDLVIYDSDPTDATNVKWIYAALGYGSHSRMSPTTLLDLYETGLYRSQDNGTTWSKIGASLTGNGGFPLQINDIEVQANTNRIWISTTSSINGTQGGRIYYSDDGTNFTQVTPTYNVAPTNIGRTEIACSHTNSQTHYVLMSANNVAEIYKTTDNFANLTKLAEPNDLDTDIPATDFTRGQSFYDLEIEVDPNDDDIIYAGGIDWFRSSDGGSNWNQISKWSNNNNLFGSPVSILHADQHGLYFRPGNSNQAVVVNDGGVAYASSLSDANTNARFVTAESNYVTTQFYTVAQSPPAAPRDIVIGGTQDNGTYLFDNPGSILGSAIDTPPGGDGAHSFFDQIGGSYAIVNYTYNDAITKLDFNAAGQYINNGGTDLSVSLAIPREGSFINPAALDSNQDAYFSNASRDTNNDGIDDVFAIRVITGLTGTPATSLITTGLSSTPSAFEVSPHTIGSTSLFVGTKDGNVLKITNANTTPSVTTLTKPGVGSISDIHFGDTEDKIYVTYFNYGNSIINIFYSTDGGTTWVQKEGNDGSGDLPDLPVYCVLNNPYEADEVIVGTELGVWKTLNFTATHPDWSLAYQGMSDVAVFDMDFRGTSAMDNRVIAGTFGRGVYVGSFRANTNPPISATDSITVIEGGTATTTTGGATSVLSNDFDPDGDSITTDLVTSTINGNLMLAPSGTGSFTYTHNGSETTTDTFYYRAFDGAVYGDTVSVTINITPVADCPSVTNPISPVSVSEDASDTLIDLNTVFSDPDSSMLTYTVTHTNVSLLSANVNTATLTLSYISNATGTATVTVTANDSSCGSSTTESFLVTVSAQNDAPVTVTESLFVLEGGTVTTTTSSNTSLLANDTDMEGNALEAQLVSMPNNGTLALSSTGTFTYTHDGSETVTDSFQYRAAEIAGIDGNTVTVTINIQEINDCPTLTNNPPISFSENEDNPGWGYNFDQFITDPDGNALMYTLTHTATNLLTASIVNQSNGNIYFVPVLNQFGTTTMTLNANDGRGCDIDILIPVTINPINDCPTVDNPITDVSATEDDPDLYIPLAGIFGDVDNNPNTDFTYSTNIGDGSLIATSFTSTALVIDFLPNQNGTTYINLIVSDGDMMCTVDDMFNVSILQTNDAPIGIGDTISLTNGSTISVLNDGTTNSVLANDSDAENNPITASLVTPPVNGTLTLAANGNFTYTHDGSATTTDSFIYSPRDGLSIGNTTTVTIYINELPVGVTETIAVLESGTATKTTNASTSVLSNDTDADPGDTAILTAVLETSPSYGTLALNSDGSFVYTHGGTEDFTDSFTYKPYDGKGYGSPTVVSINVTPTNDPPVAFADIISVGLGQTTTILSDGTNNVLLNDTDPDGDSLTAAVVTGPNFGTLVLNPGGTFSYVQNGTMNGGDSFTYKANDGLLDSNIVTVNINLTCSPCTEYIIEAGSSGVLLSYQGCDCRNYNVYVPKGKSYTFCHLDNTVTIAQGSYTILTSEVCN